MASAFVRPGVRAAVTVIAVLLAGCSGPMGPAQALPEFRQDGAFQPPSVRVGGSSTLNVSLSYAMANDLPAWYDFSASVQVPAGLSAADNADWVGRIRPGQTVFHEVDVRAHHEGDWRVVLNTTLAAPGGDEGGTRLVGEYTLYVQP